MNKRKSMVEEKEEDADIMIMNANTSSDITVYIFSKGVLTKEELKHIRAITGKRPDADYCNYTKNYSKGRVIDIALDKTDFLASLVYVGIALKQFSEDYDILKEDIFIRNKMPNPVRPWEGIATLVFSSDISEFEIPVRKTEAKIGMKCFKIGHFIVDDYYH